MSSQVLGISELGPRHARSVLGGVRSGSKTKCAARLPDPDRRYTEQSPGRVSSVSGVQRISFIVFKKAVALTCATWFDVEERKPLSDHPLHARACFREQH